MTYTNPSDPQRNAFYPRFASDLADALTDELDEGQIRQLYDALKTTELATWLGWLEESWAEICEHGALSPAERKRLLRKPERTAALRLQHALIFVELWRTRTHVAYVQFPPHGYVPDNPQDQYRLMLGCVRAYMQFDPRDLWTFEVPEGVDFFPLFPFLT